MTTFLEEASMRKRVIRLAVGLAFAVAVAAYLPNVVTASPSCADGQEGEHYSNDPIMMSPSSCPNAGMCKVGYQEFWWDCVRSESGDLYVSNVRTSSPTFCTWVYGIRCCDASQPCR
jgi:hypothetical protein